MLYVEFRSHWPRGLRLCPRPLPSWDCGFEFCRRHGYLLWVLCVVRYRSLRRDGLSPRGVIPSVVCRWVWSRHLKNEEVTTRFESQHHRKENSMDIWHTGILKFSQPCWWEFCFRGYDVASRCNAISTFRHPLLPLYLSVVESSST
jgi:hypothetical protein